MILEMWEAQNLDSARTLEQALKDTVAAIDGTMMDLRVVEFPVHGVTGVAVIAESHVAVHTWPEHGYAAVDIFTCNLDADIDAGIEAMKRHFLPGRTQVMEVRRGILD
jgi:S-adenosylmethionine decarboxylase proenzyme